MKSMSVDINLGIMQNTPVTNTNNYEGAFRLLRMEEHSVIFYSVHQIPTTAIVPVASMEERATID